MYKLVFIVLISFTLISCSQSYTVPRATIHIDFPHSDNLTLVKNEVEAFLLSKGFAARGKDNEMLKLYEWSKSNEKSNSLSDFQDIQIDRINRTSTYKNETLNVDVKVIDYSDVALKKRFIDYQNSESEVTAQPSLELNIYNYRPGGFSLGAHEFYREFMSHIATIKDTSPIVIFRPPATNPEEYYKVYAINIVWFIVWWTICYSVSIGLFGLIIKKLMSRLSLTTKSKQSIFTLGGTVLCTPLPFPVSIFSIISLPSIFAIPSIGSDYFIRIQEFAIPSFIFSFLLCLKLSKRYVNKLEGLR